MKEQLIEGIQNFEFTKEFKARLLTIKEKSAETSYTDFYQEVGISRVRRKAAALVFPSKSNEVAPLEIWIDEIDDNGYFIHGRANRSFELVFPNVRDEIPFFRAHSAMIVQDWDNKLYLFLDEVLKKCVQEMKKEETMLGIIPEKNPTSWEKLMKDYDISKIAGTVKRATREDGREHTEWVDEVFLEEDIIGKLRETQMLNVYKHKYSRKLI